MGAYDDILHLPHHRSEKHPPMSMRDRAAQFSSFRALSGYEDAIGETARLTDRRIERGEEEQHRLDAILRQLECRLAEKPTVTVTYFRPDDRNALTAPSSAGDDAHIVPPRCTNKLPRQMIAFAGVVLSNSHTLNWSSSTSPGLCLVRKPRDHAPQ